jgi:transcription antitermination factor NusG
VDIDSGKFYTEKELADLLGFKDKEDKRLIEELAKKKRMITFSIGDEVKIKGGKFKIVYINAGKNRITLEGIPYKKWQENLTGFGPLTANIK